MAISALSICPRLCALLVPFAVGFASGIGSTALLFILPGIALADNCSSLGDCWSSAGGAASAAFGSALGAIGGLFGGGGGGFSGRGAGGSWPEPEPAPPPPPPDRFPNYPFPGPGEEGGEKAARVRVREYWKEIHRGDRPRRTVDDAMKDLESVVPKLDLDEEQERHYWEESEKKMPYAQRG